MINTLLTWAALTLKSIGGFMGGIAGCIAIWAIVILWVYGFYKINQWLQLEDAGLLQFLLWQVWLLGWAAASMGLSKLGDRT